MVIHSKKIRNHNHLYCLERGFRRAWPRYQTLVTSRNNQVSHSTTATTHRIPLDIYPGAALYESAIEFVIICWVVGPDSSWRSTTAEICDKIVEFLHRFASITIHASTKDRPWPKRALEYTKGRCLMPFPLSSCSWLSFSINIGISSQHPKKSGVNLHETLRYL